MSSDLSIVGKRMTMRGLLDMYSRIEIPMIQRDYAQGRKSPNVEEVRERFIRAMLDELFQVSSQTKGLNLDFIYGSVSENVFVPFDGQQRLTTLFLMYWYAAWRNGRQDEYMKLVRKSDRCGFTYRTRISSGDFFDELTQNFLDPGIVASEGISSALQDSHWFRTAWNQDPTVRSALVMLDEIHRQFAKRGDVPADIFIRMDRITFDILDLGSRSGDDLYIKMNARGKPLTPFEHFKAWYERSGASDVTWSVPDWKEALDKRWLNGMWDLRKDGEPQVDGAYLRVIYALALGRHAVRDKSPMGEGELKKLAGRIQQGGNLQISDWVKLFDDEARKSLFDGLDKSLTGPCLGVLKGKTLPLREPEKLLSFFHGSTAPAWADWVLFHALAEFYRLPAKASLDAEKRWFRVVENLLNNSGISNDNYLNAVNSISRLALYHEDDVLGYLAGMDKNGNQILDEFKGLQLDQAKEEVQKAKLILGPDSGKDWEDAIVKAEGHLMLKGQIGFMLDGLGHHQLEEFKQRCKAVETLFDMSGSIFKKDTSYLVIRAALACCGRDVPLEWQESLVMADNAAEWKKLMRHPHVRGGITRMLDELKGTKEASAIQAKLEGLCQKYDATVGWIYDIVKHGAVLLDNSETKRIQKYYDNGTFMFFKTYSNRRDVLLGEYARRRNQAITSLITEHGWKLPDVETWRLIKLHDASEYFCDHRIVLESKEPHAVRIVFVNLSCKVEQVVDKQWKQYGDEMSFMKDVSAEDIERCASEAIDNLTTST